LDKAGDVELNYTDGSTCIREAENETCEVQRDGVVTYIGMLERYNAYILTKRRGIFLNLLCVCMCIQQFE
jgi:hypothetical protein